MTQDLSLSCRCGHIRGRLRDASPARGQRMRCYCRDCQTYAEHLGQADRVLDAHGGTALFQTTPHGLSFGQGQDQLACLRLSPKGPLRWYARCCNTPLANTMSSAGMPFVALLGSCWGDGAEQMLGERETGVYASHARGDSGQLDAHATVPVGVMLKVGARLLAARLRGEQRESPFFDPASGRPVVEPQILSREERAAAARNCGPQAAA